MLELSWSYPSVVSVAINSITYWLLRIYYFSQMGYFESFLILTYFLIENRFLVQYILIMVPLSQFFLDFPHPPKLIPFYAVSRWRTNMQQVIKNNNIK